jgi:peptide/nickel transport system substrate-binding protein
MVVNDLSPDIVWQLREEGRLRTAEADGTDYAYLGINMRHPVLANAGVRRAIGHAIDRGAIVRHLRRGLAKEAAGIVPPMSWAYEPGVFAFRHDVAEAKRLLDAAGLTDPDGEGPLPRLSLTLRTSTSEVYRLQAAAIQHDLAAAGIHVDVRRYRPRQLPALYGGIRRRHRSGHAAAGLPFRAAAAGWPESRPLRQRGRRSVDRRRGCRGR